MTKEKYISYLTVKIGATEKQKARIETECDKLNVGSGSIIEQWKIDVLQKSVFIHYSALKKISHHIEEDALNHAESKFKNIVKTIAYCKTSSDWDNQLKDEGKFKVLPYKLENHPETMVSFLDEVRVLIDCELKNSIQKIENLLNVH